MLARLCDRCGCVICAGDNKTGRIELKRVELKAEDNSGIIFNADICETCFGALKNFMSEGKMQKELTKFNEQVVRKNALNRAKKANIFS